MAIIAAFVAGILGWIGVLMNAQMGRRLEHEKWLRQERNNASDAFDSFLLKMKDFQRQASDLVLKIKNTHEDRRLNLQISLSELQLDFETKANPVLRYLSEIDRETFLAALKDQRDVQHEIVSDGRRMNTQEKVQNTIRDLFEKVLHSKYSITGIPS